MEKLRTQKGFLICGITPFYVNLCRLQSRQAVVNKDPYRFSVLSHSKKVCKAEHHPQKYHLIYI